MNFLPFPELRTERLKLRRVLKSDCDVILYLRSDEQINKYIKRPEHRKTKTKEDALKHIEKLDTGIEEGSSVSWVITVLDNSKVVGTICLWNISEDRKTGEVGYDLNPDFQGKGIMGDAMNSVLTYGFKEIKLDKVTAYTHGENTASKNLLERNGFNLAEGLIDEGNASNIIFEILKVDFKRV
ncbi:MAG: GNAT family N-acetyltransferase [Crocinitomicaceae bacterium]|nr:GNAT family N-acetyltransferase [Crocinitomicaceae bacterium]